jgi:hypothetical protein
VRKTGLEPVRPCERHPLKMVRLPISPLPQRDCENSDVDPDGKTKTSVFFDLYRDIVSGATERTPLIITQQT